MVARLVECSDHDCQYGILTVENVDLKEVQDKIYEIKRRFSDEGFNDWTINDVFMEFPEEWEWSYNNCQACETVEI